MVLIPRRSVGPERTDRGINLPGVENVPTVRGASDPGVRVPQGAFDSGGSALQEAARGIEVFSDQLAQAEQRMQSRKDAVELARSVSQYNEAANTEFRRISTEEDLSSEDTLNAYRDFLEKNKAETLGRFSDNEGFKLRVDARLEGVRSIALDRAAIASVQEQRKLVSKEVGKASSQLVARAVEFPQEIPELFESLDATIDDMAPALSPDEEAGFRQAGRAQIIAEAATALLDQGSADGAERVLSIPGASDVLDGDTASRLKRRVMSVRDKMAEAATAGARKIAEAEFILGRKATPAERAKIAGVQPAEGRQTVSGKIAEVESALGRPLSESERARVAGVAGSEFGTGITGRALEIMTENAEAFGAGLLSPAEERRFISAVTQYTQPTTIQNPDTGLIETRRPELPPFVRDVMQRRGVSASDGQNDAFGTGQPGQGGAEATSPGNAEAPDQTIWDLSGISTGPVPAIGEAVGRTPIIGDIFPSQQITQARNFIPLVQRELVRVLQNNPKYAEGERIDIEKEINIKPQIFDTPTAFRNRLIAIDQALEVRERNAFQTAQSNRVGREERIQAMNVLNGLVKFRASLGVPPRFKTPDEVRKAVSDGQLKSGDQFIDNNGNIRSVP